MPQQNSPNLIVGYDTSDDACVYKISDQLAIIQTVDFFPPVVDDAYLFGQIAAANALSDVYAMGAVPSLALNILCFPNCLPMDMLQAIMAGGAKKVHEAGAVIAGGHSIDDAEPKYGLCVTGMVHPDAIWTNAMARVGDVLILTKSIGSGILNTAAKCDLLTAKQLQPAFDTMSMLNKYARDAAVAMTVHACTDITGFGLLGHVFEMADASHVTIEVQSSSIPILPYTMDMAKKGIVSSGVYRNKEYLKGKVRYDKTIPLPLEDIMFDPQTSGGLLFSVPKAEAEMLMQRLSVVCPQAAVIGHVQPSSEHAVSVVSR